MAEPGISPDELAGLMSRKILRRLRVWSNPVESDCTLRIELYGSYDRGEPPFVVEFLQVSGFYLSASPDQKPRTGAFLVEDARHLQHEGVRFVFRDIDPETLSFSCVSFRILAQPGRSTDYEARRDMLKSEFARAVNSAFPERAGDLLLQLDRALDD